ncbi:hypothetical protein MAR_011428 [Mya arenaria]|uniref:Uncharacterized protein n=1 Tax=Mya arenaria TaxID=6604 RepID=A0ABY7FWS9_MYAAR|nr:hypothetical protein MAR_011428 [Mya arenaria]
MNKRTAIGVEICIQQKPKNSSALRLQSRDLHPTARQFFIVVWVTKSSVEDCWFELWFKPVLISVGFGGVSGAHLCRIGLCILRAKWTVIASTSFI